MPVYEYTCPRCKADFEVLRPIHRMAEAVTCPTCAATADRRLSVFAATTVGSDGAMLPMAGGGGCGCGGNCACSM